MKDALFALLHTYPLIFVGGAGLIALEAWAWYVMHASYFTQGLPIHKFDIAVRPPSGDAARWLSEVQPRGFWGEFRFKALDSKAVALREFIDWKRPWRPHYPLLLRAVIELDAARGRLRMTAFLNYWLPLLLLPGLLAALHRADTLLRGAMVLFGYALVVVGPYIIQLIRYQSLLTALEKQGQISKEPPRFSGL